jgi:hypothetical protein
LLIVQDKRQQKKQLFFLLNKHSKLFIYIFLDLLLLKRKNYFKNKKQTFPMLEYLSFYLIYLFIHYSKTKIKLILIIQLKKNGI